MFPIARKTGLLIEQVESELLVYDTANHHAHTLNSTTSLIWEQCDGQKDGADIAALLRLKLGSPIDEKLIWKALVQLSNANLLQSEFVQPKPKTKMTRRTLLLNMAVAAVALPLITSIVAPQPAAAASGATPCGAQSGSCTGFCTGSGACKKVSGSGTCGCIA